MNFIKLFDLLALICIVFQSADTYNDFIVKIFSKYKKVSSVVGAGVCWKQSDTIKMIKAFSDFKIRSSFPPSNVDPFKSLLVPDAGGIGVLIQSDCPDSKTYLEKASELMIFNRTYKWLILAENETNPDNIFRNLEIRIDADVTLSLIKENTIEIYDVYGFLAREGQPLVVNFIGNYTEENGLYIKRQEIKFRARSNFNRYPILAGTVITQNPCDINGSASELLAARGPSKGIATLTKYHNDLITIAKDIFNFTLIYKVDEAWAGYAPNGTPVGILGSIRRREVDVLATGIYIIENRADEMDMIPSYWIFETALMYRVSELDGGQEGSLTKPFLDEVWIASSVIAIAILLFLRCSGRRGNEFNSWGLSSLSTLAAFCQQGLEPCPSHVSQRIITLVLYIATLLLYNYYTSSIVGYLLSVDPIGLDTIEQVADSPLTIVFEKIGYGEVLVKRRQLPGMETLYQKKLKKPRSPDEPPLFVSNMVGVSLLQKERIAYHTEPQNIYPLIASTFDQKDICALRQVGVYKKATLCTVLPKRSPLTKMFSIGILKAKERGLTQRFLNMRFSQKPACTSNFVAPVALNGVTAAFKLLAFGTALSLIILVIECIKRPKKLKVTGGGRRIYD